MALSTAQDIIDSSLRLLGVIDQEGGATTAQRNQGLDALNAFIDSLALDGLVNYVETNEAVTLTAAATTWGAAGTIATTRPISITTARRVVDGYEYPLQVLSMIEYLALVDKSVTGTIWAVAYDATMPTGTLYAVGGVGAIKATSIKPWGQYSGLTTAHGLPPGYTRGIRHALAIELAPEYSVEAPSVSKEVVAKFKADLATFNARVYPLVNQMLLHRGQYDGRTDRFMP